MAFGCVKKRHPFVGEPESTKCPLRVAMVLPSLGHNDAGIATVYAPVAESMPVCGEGKVNVPMLLVEFDG
jgi:hypothetical protein